MSLSIFLCLNFCSVEDIKNKTSFNFDQETNNTKILNYFDEQVMFDISRLCYIFIKIIYDYESLQSS